MGNLRHRQSHPFFLTQPTKNWVRRTGIEQRMHFGLVYECFAFLEYSMPAMALQAHDGCRAEKGEMPEVS